MKPRPLLIVMVKEPRAGRVKTRLARDIGTPAAAWWMRHQIRALLRRLSDPRWELRLSVAPDRALGSRALPAGAGRMPQGGGDLGERMLRALRSRQTAPVLVIGADIPDITRAHIARAFTALGRAEAVLGPAPDGGYWLLGMRRGALARAGLLRGVGWSHAGTRAETIAALPAAWRVAQVDVLADVDEVADLNR
ncbi:MAG: TIGR04282 family arsenosugar biosynthesis glycosyltransferase [Marinobacter sp.]